MTLHPTASDAGKRLDIYVAESLPEYSRSRIQGWIKEGRVLVDGKAGKTSYEVRGREAIEVDPGELPPLKAEAEDLPLEVLYEDANVIAVNKPAGMVVHAGAGNWRGTLVNALLHRFQRLSEIGGEFRPGIVHRLDRYTSGVLLVARNDAAHRFLAEQFASRKVKKVYLALVHGVIQQDQGHIEKPIERDPVHRTRMTVKTGSGRPALTDFRVLRRFARHTFIEVRIGTGRTHQIRVHMASLGHPVAGDRLYGAPKMDPDPGRFFLHAHEITFSTPGSRKTVTVDAPLPAELEAWLARPL